MSGLAIISAIILSFASAVSLIGVSSLFTLSRP